MFAKTLPANYMVSNNVFCFLWKWRRFLCCLFVCLREVDLKRLTNVCYQHEKWRYESIWKKNNGSFDTLSSRWLAKVSFTSFFHFLLASVFSIPLLHLSVIVVLAISRIMRVYCANEIFIRFNNLYFPQYNLLLLNLLGSAAPVIQELTENWELCVEEKKNRSISIRVYYWILLLWMSAKRPCHFVFKLHFFYWSNFSALLRRRSLRRSWRCDIRAFFTCLSTCIWILLLFFLFIFPHFT